MTSPLGAADRRLYVVVFEGHSFRVRPREISEVVHAGTAVIVYTVYDTVRQDSFVFKFGEGNVYGSGYTFFSKMRDVQRGMDNIPDVTILDEETSERMESDLEIRARNSFTAMERRIQELEEELDKLKGKRSKSKA